jgi:hypothetical protein
VLRLDDTFGGDEIAYLQASMKEEFQNPTSAGLPRRTSRRAGIFQPRDWDSGTRVWRNYPAICDVRQIVLRAGV